MEMDSIVQVISSVGFPIAMCLILMWFWSTQFTKTIDEIKEVVSRLNDVVADNTKALELLEQRLGMEREDK